MQVNIYSVSQVNNYIKRLLENDVFLSSLYIEGEVSNFKLHSSGHLYFSLKDKTGGIDCVMFRSYAQELTFLPQNGENVLVNGYVSLYEKTGKYQFYVTYMQPAGKGMLYLAFEQLKARLMAEGLFDAEHKKAICPYPKTVAVITSPTGAAIRDIINVTKRRNPSVRIVVVPVLVQGEAAANDIANGINLVNKWGGADTIIVGRGGGSMEDLWAFNEEVVARAIYNSQIPVISAVGHEVDFTIADFVADLRAATPSAAAELAVPAVEPLDKQNKTALKRIETAMQTRIVNAGLRLRHAVGVRGIKKPLDTIYNYQIVVEEYLGSMQKCVNRCVDRNIARLEKNMAVMESLSPVNVVKRGYSLSYDADKNLIKSVNQVKTNDNITLEVADGNIFAVVTAVKGGNA